MSNPFREIYVESLKGGQKKLDVDKDGKIEGEDLAKLRSSKQVKKEAAEVPFSGPYTKTKAVVTDKSGAKHTPMSRVKHLAQMAAKKAEDAKKSVKEEVKDKNEEDEDDEDEKKEMKEGLYTNPGLEALLAKKRAEKAAAAAASASKTKKVKEEVEQIEELSKTTLASYAYKAAGSASDKAKEAERRASSAKDAEKRAKDPKLSFAKSANQAVQKHDMKKSAEASKKSEKRLGGVLKAVSRLAYKEEVEQIDEVEKATGGLKDACWKGYTAVGMKMKNGKKVPNCVPTKEEIEIDDDLLNELNKTTLGSYVTKASKNARINSMVAKDLEHKSETSRKPSNKTTFKDLATDFKKNAWKREAGIEKAVTRLTKEEIEILLSSDELDESIKKKLAAAALAAGMAFGAAGAKAAEKPAEPVTQSQTQKADDKKVEKESPEKAGEMKLNLRPTFKKQVKEEAELQESDAAYAAAIEKRKEKLLTQKDQDALAKVRALMAKEKAAKMKKEEVEQIEEKSDQAKQNKTMKNMMAASKGAQINRGLKLEPAEYGYKKAQHLNKAIGRAAIRAEETEMEFTQEELTLIEQFIEIAEKMNMSKASMGDVIRDFKKSDAPQFAGKSMEKRRQMAIAAKLSADRETKKEEFQLVSFKGYSLDEVKMADLPSRKVTGRGYGTEYYKKEKEKDEKGYDADDEKESSEKRGRGRPAGSKSGARQKGSTTGKKKSGVEMTGYPLHLPNR